MEVPVHPTGLTSVSIDFRWNVPGLDCYMMLGTK